MNKLSILIFVFVFSSLEKEIFSQSRYNMIYQPQLGIYAGAENITSIHYLWKSFDNTYIPSILFKGKNTRSKLGNISYRISKLFLLDYPITFLLPTVQHEFFGHGGRVREFGAEVKKISISLPPPFGNPIKNSFIQYTYNINTPKHEKILITSGGSEANAILAEIIRKNILLDDKLDYYNSLIYLYSNNDLSGYTVFVTNTGDVVKYIDSINDYYRSESLTLKKLRTYALISIITDPINYYSLYSIFKNYIIDGEKNISIPLIKISSNIRYLPKFRFRLTPYGPDLLFQNYIKHRNKLYSVDFSHSDNTFISFWSLGLGLWNWKPMKNITLNFRGWIWNQPKIEGFEYNTLKNDKELGGAIIGTIYYDLISKTHILGSVFQIGYKSNGFLEGEKLYSGMIVSGGISFR